MDLGWEAASKEVPMCRVTLLVVGVDIDDVSRGVVGLLEGVLDARVAIDGLDAGGGVGARADWV